MGKQYLLYSMLGGFRNTTKENRMLVQRDNHCAADIPGDFTKKMTKQSPAGLTAAIAQMKIQFKERSSCGSGEGSGIFKSCAVKHPSFLTHRTNGNVQPGDQPNLLLPGKPCKS